MMVKRIWIVNPYLEPPEIETRLRDITFAKNLIERGYEVKLFGGSFIHNSDNNLILGDERMIEKKYDMLDFVHIKTTPYKGNGLARFKNLYMFYHNFKKVYKKFEEPDLLLHNGSIPFGFDLYKVANRLKCRYFTEVDDLWPESFVAYGLIKRNSFIHRALKKFEFIQYKHAEKIIFTMEGARDYVIEQGWSKKIDLDKVHYINNGVDLNAFNTHVESYKIDDEDLCSDKFKVIYLGSIRLANNLMQLIKAAECLDEQNITQIEFLIYGDGPEREKLENYVLEKGIKNIKFKQKYVTIEYVPFILSNSSLNILNYMDNEIWKYGGSQSKLFQYLASGKPILSNLKIGYCIVSKYKCGLTQSFKSEKEYAEAILSFYRLDKESYQGLCLNAKSASKIFDYKKLTQEFIELF